jgi:CubicO group peptidase (beta-lactamase class C family)
MNGASSFTEVRLVLERAVRARAFPAAVIEVGTGAAPLWHESFGRLWWDVAAPVTPPDAVFDLASLTKVLATSLLVMRRVEAGTLDLDGPVADTLANWVGDDRARVTIRDLLSHCSGLPAYLPLYRQYRGGQAYAAAIGRTPLDYAPRSTAVYSDLGFILLGLILEREGPLPHQFEALKTMLSPAGDLRYHPPAEWMPRTAPTQQNAWRNRLLRGEVDDDNAWALGGAAGHAGLFGTASAVGDSARHLLQVLEGRAGAIGRRTLEECVARRDEIPGSSRALGWDTMLPTSSCGRLMSTRAFGHTGFTGTSLWIDPDEGVYVVLLTNRTHPTASNELIKEVRPAVHDAVMRAVRGVHRPG